MPRTFYAIASDGTCTADTANCSGRAGSGTMPTVAADETGPATIYTAQLTSSAADTVFATDFVGSRRIGFVEISPAIAAWAAGNYGVAVEVTTANMNLTLTEVHLCRRSSSCGAVATIGSLTGIARDLGSTGSVTHTVSGSANTTSSSDKLIVILVGSNGAMSTQSCSIKVTVTTSAFDAPAQAPAPSIKVIRQAVMRATLH